MPDRPQPIRFENLCVILSTTGTRGHIHCTHSLETGHVFQTKLYTGLSVDMDDPADVQASLMSAWHESNQYINYIMKCMYNRGILL